MDESGLPEVLEDQAMREQRVLPTFQELWEEAELIMPHIVQVRRELHRSPELMYDEVLTGSLITRHLDSLGISYTRGWAQNTKHAELLAKGMRSGIGGTGIVAEIGSGAAPCVLLRADIDALPIQEAEGLIPFTSDRPGEMHACGHDGHAAMLIGAAAILKDLDQSGHINGTIRLIWQPAEEGGAGGKRMIEEGVLTKDPPVQAAFGFHQWPFLPLGTIGGRPGTMLAAAELFDIIIGGKGGHAAMPHAVIDPIVTAAHVITGLQAITARETDPLDSAVVSVTMIHAGSAYNVIPDGARISGTVRSLTNEGLNRLRRRVEAVAGSVSAAHECNASVSWSPDAYPPTVNDPDLYQWVEGLVKNTSAYPGEEGNGGVTRISPTMGGEDFSFITEKVPSVFLVLGQGEKAWHGVDDEGVDFGPIDTTVTVHNSKFVLNEGVLIHGVVMHAHLALEKLKVLRGGGR